MSRRVLGYLAAFFEDPKVAAVTPSSRYLVARVLRAMRLDEARVVVEFGAARGVMTRPILERLRPDARCLAVERNQELFEGLKPLRDPRLSVVRGDVREIDRLPAARGLAGRVDVVVSGVPFAFFSEKERRELLEKTSALLRPGGRFVAYQVTTHLIPLLKRHFARVRVEFELRNLPPHFVFTAIK